MAFDQESGTASFRARFYDKTVKQVAERQYKFKQALSIVPTSAWKNFFYQESTTVLSGKTGNSEKGLPRGAAFPHANKTYQQVQSNLDKYGMEQVIHWEDIITDDIDVEQRALIKIAEGVVKAVDDEIFRVLSESGSPSNINSITLGAAASWASSTANIIDNLMNAKQLIAEDNYDTSNLMCFINPLNHRNIVNWLASKGAQFPSIGQDVAANGQCGKLAGIDLVMSVSVPASLALVCVPKTVGTWREAVPLQTTTIEDKYRSRTVRAVEMGVTQLTDPGAACLIIGTA